MDRFYPSSLAATDQAAIVALGVFRAFFAFADFGAFVDFLRAFAFFIYAASPAGSVSPKARA